MKKTAKKVVKSQETAARKRLLQELFEDFYDNRVAVYRVNFFRGIAFGLGSVLGGTIVVALLIYLLAFLSQFIPPLSDLFDAISRLIDDSRGA